MCKTKLPPLLMEHLPSFLACLLPSSLSSIVSSLLPCVHLSICPSICPPILSSSPTRRMAATDPARLCNECVICKSFQPFSPPLLPVPQIWPSHEQHQGEVPAALRNLRLASVETGTSCPNILRLRDVTQDRQGGFLWLSASSGHY